MCAIVARQSDRLRNVGNKMPTLSIRTAKTALIAAMLIIVSPYMAVYAQAARSASSPVNLSSVVKIERIDKGVAGKEAAVLRDPKDVVVVPGDKVVFTLNVVNSGSEPAAGFRAVNPIPAAVNFVAVEQDWAEVSVDGGISWGKLSALTVNTKSQDDAVVTIARAAVPDDVTHIRWVFADAIAAGSTSSVSYRGVVK